MVGSGGDGPRQVAGLHAPSSWRPSCNPAPETSPFARGYGRAQQGFGGQVVTLLRPARDLSASGSRTQIGTGRSAYGPLKACGKRRFAPAPRIEQGRERHHHLRDPRLQDADLLRPRLLHPRRPDPQDHHQRRTRSGCPASLTSAAARHSPLRNPSSQAGKGAITLVDRSTTETRNYP